mmetsp:Transcript_28886/g.49226  ORF Transcript_28886/g.49226 Transcript_28886/m.49226 type:complete len:84 (-) Transcript_28886:34-285(-)
MHSEVQSQEELKPLRSNINVQDILCVKSSYEQNKTGMKTNKVVYKIPTLLSQSQYHMCYALFSRFGIRKGQAGSRGDRIPESP